MPRPSFLLFCRSTRQPSCCKSPRRPCTTGRLADSSRDAAGAPANAGFSGATASSTRFSTKGSILMANDENQNNEYEQVGEFVRIFQRGDKWYANFQVAGQQKRQSLKTTSKKEARRRALRIERDL